MCTLRERTMKYLLPVLWFVAVVSSKIEMDILVIVSSDSTAEEVGKNQVIAGAQHSLQEIKQYQFPFELKLTYLQFEDCSVPAVPLARTIWEMLDSGRHTIAVVGLVCENMLRDLLEITNRHRLGLITVILNQYLPDIEVQQENYYHVFSSSMEYAELLAQFVHQVTWTKIVLVTKHINLYNKMAEKITTILTERNINAVIVTAGRAEEETVKAIHETGITKAYYLLPLAETVRVICSSYEYGLKWPDYTWIVPHISLEDINKTITNAKNDCHPEAVEGIVSFQIAAENDVWGTKNIPVCDTISKSIYIAMYNWIQTIHFAINSTHSEITENINVYNTSYTTQKELSTMVAKTLQKYVNSSGKFGKLFFKDIVVSYQTSKISSYTLASYSFQTNTTLFANSSSFPAFPSETLQRVYRILPRHVDAVFTAGLAACILLITLNMCLYIFYCQAPEMKASSVGLSMTIFISCYIICAGCALDLKTSTYIVSSDAVCMTIQWAIHPWSDAILTTILVLNGRVYHIFSQFKRMTKLAADKNLLVVIFLVFLGKVVLLSLWTGLDMFKLVDVEVYHPEGKPPYFELVQECHSEYFFTWIVIVIGYSGVLLGFVMYVSYKTRKVHRKDFKNTKKVNTLLVVVVISLAILLPLWWIFRSANKTVMSRVTLISLFLIIPVSCQICLFCPKVIPPLVRTVSKRIHKKEHVSYERKMTMERIVFLQKPDPSQLSLSIQKTTDSM